MEILTAAGLAALFQVIAIDLVLAGDNAIVIGLAAAGLPAEQRRKAILVGIIAATILRIGLCDHYAYLLGLVGLQLLGEFCLPGLLEDVERIAPRRRRCTGSPGEAEAEATKVEKTFFQPPCRLS